GPLEPRGPDLGTGSQDAEGAGRPVRLCPVSHLRRTILTRTARVRAGAKIPGGGRSHRPETRGNLPDRDDQGNPRAPARLPSDVTVSSDLRRDLTRFFGRTVHPPHLFGFGTGPISDLRVRGIVPFFKRAEKST